MGLSFFLHIISLRKWFDNKAKNEALLEIKQSLLTNNEQLADRIKTIENQKLPDKKNNTIEKDSINLANKTQSLSNGIVTLSERIHTVELDIHRLLFFMMNNLISMAHSILKCFGQDSKTSKIN